MMDKERQQAFLMAQLNKKRELKQKYLYQSENAMPQDRPDNAHGDTLGGHVMTNIMLLAIKERKDVFGAMNRIRSDAHAASFGGTLFDAVMNWCGELAEALDCGVYEFFIDDKSRQQRIVHSLLDNLKRDSRIQWEDIHIDDSGSASFTLPYFDSYYRMTKQPVSDISLVFQKETETDGRILYRLMVGDMAQNRPDGLIPDFAVLWEEFSGELKKFVDTEIADLEGGWMLFREDFERRSRLFIDEAAKLKDLCAVLEEQPEGLNVQALLQKEKQLLEQLSGEEHAVYNRMPAALKAGPRGENVKNRLLLLGGAVKSLERAILPLSAPEQTDILSETAYLLENAGGAMQ